MKPSPALEHLEKQDLVRRLVDEELEYVFKHALVQDTAYTSLLKQDRRRLHRAVGEILEQIHSDKGDELSGLLAHHFAAADERAKAIEYSRRAARWSIETYAYEEAAQYFRSALALLPDEGSREIKLILLEELGDVYQLFHNGTRAMSLYQQAVNLCADRTDADKITALRLHRKILQSVADIRWSVDVESFKSASQNRLASRDHLVASLPRMKEKPANPETIRLFTVLATDAWRTQIPPDWIAAQQFAEQAVEIGEQLNSPTDLSRALGALAGVLDGDGLLRKHLQVSLKRLEISQDPRMDDLRERIDALQWAGVARMYVGEYRQAIPPLVEAEHLASRIQAVDLQFHALALQEQCWFRLDRWNDALDLEAQWRALEEQHTRERLGATCHAVAIGAVIRTLRGDTQEARVLQKDSYDYMVMVSGPPEQWQRNQHY